MTPRIGAVCALSLALAATPATTAAADPPYGELVIVADGHASGSVTFASPVHVLSGGATYETDSPYVLFAFLDGGQMKAGTDWWAGADWEFPLVYPGEVDAGTTTVRVLTDGPTTIRVPVDGLTGTVTVNLTDPLPGAVAEVVDVTPVGNVATSEIPLTVDPYALTMHAYVHAGGTGVARAQTMCVATGPCAEPGAGVGGQPGDWAKAYFPWDGLSGPVTGRLVIADAGVVGSTKHFLISMPMS